MVYLWEPVTGANLGLRPADGGAHRYYEVGIEHLAFPVDSPEEVDGAYERCLARSANVHCPPENDRDIEGYYALFVFDPDGIRIEVFSWPGADELAQLVARRQKGALTDAEFEAQKAKILGAD